jgi:pyruvate dehydrogenase E1 component alpha subunit
MTHHIKKEELIGMYKNMLRARMLEPVLAELQKNQKISVAWHPGDGQEAIGAGAGAALRRDDYIIHTHRGCGHVIAKGLSLRTIVAGFFGKATGALRGKGQGIPHWADPDLGIMGQSGTLGGNHVLAMGIGLAIRMKGTDQVVVGFFGDGTANRGTFHEALNMASIWKLPVIFFCENNQYGWSLNVTKSTSIENIADRAASYSMPGIVVDGSDVVAVYETTLEAVRRAREGKGPTLIEGKTYRFGPHQILTDPQVYRSREELEEVRRHDPIEKHRERLLDTNVLTKEDDERIRQEVQTEIEDAVRFAEESPLPKPERAFEDLWA